jgi:hypothetical protein
MDVDSHPPVRVDAMSRATKVVTSLLAAVLLSLLAGGTSWASPPPVPPGPPTYVMVTPGNQQAIVTWQGTYAGWGYFPDGYVAKTNHGGPTCSAVGIDSTTCTLTGLTNGVLYSVTVHATYTKVGRSGTKEFNGHPSAKVKFIPAA